jgi:hypothetical protein
MLRPYNEEDQITCCFPKGGVPHFLLETKMTVHGI